MTAKTWLTGFATNDRIKARHIKAGWGMVDNVVAGGSVANIQVTAGSVAPGASLLVIAYLRSAAAVLSDSIQMQMNGRSGADYSWAAMYIEAATPAAFEGVAQTSARVGRCPGTTAPANSFSCVRILFPNHRSLGTSRCYISRSVGQQNTTSGRMLWEHHGGYYFGTPPLRLATVKLFTGGGGNLAAGSRVTSYVLGAPAATLPVGEWLG